MKILLSTVIVSAAIMSIPIANATDSVNYTYDPRGRVTQASYANGTTIVFTYDDANNLLVTTTSCNAGSPC